jgi:hypothetical protein
MSDCLHCDINEIVRKHIEQNESVDLADLVARMSESLVELIMLAPEQEHAKLMAEAMAHIGHVFLQETGAIEGESSTTH